MDERKNDNSEAWGDSFIRECNNRRDADKLATLKRQHDMLLEALKHYGRHQVMGEMCAALVHGDNPCTCGLDAAIAAVEVGE